MPLSQKESLLDDILELLYDGSDNAQAVKSTYNFSYSISGEFPNNLFDTEEFRNLEDKSLPEEQKTNLRESAKSLFQIIINESKLLQPTNSENCILIYMRNRSAIDNYDLDTLNKAINMINDGYYTIIHGQSNPQSEVGRNAKDAYNYYKSKLESIIPDSFEEFMWFYCNAKDRIKYFEKDVLSNAKTILTARSQSGNSESYTPAKVLEARNYYADALSVHEYIDLPTFIEFEVVAMDHKRDSSVTELRNTMIKIKKIKNMRSNSSNYPTINLDDAEKAEEYYKIFLTNDIRFFTDEELTVLSKSEIEECKVYVNEANIAYLKRRFPNIEDSYDGDYSRDVEVAFATNKRLAQERLDRLLKKIEEEERKEDEERREDEERSRGNFSSFVSDFSGSRTSTSVDYSGATTVLGRVGTVVAIIRNIGIIVSLVCITIIGIKYMIGSVEEKAEYKKTLIPFAFGLIFFTGIVTILSFVITFAKFTDSL